MVELEVLGIHSDGQSSPMVLLRHEERVLPILVGFPEADAILAALTKRDFGRPMTHDLICNLLAGLRGQLKSVTIYKLEGNTFYAYLNIEQLDVNGQVEEVLRVDSRPSDSIAIALRVGAPIFAAEEVMRVSQDISVTGLADDEGESGEHPEEESEDEPDEDAG